MNRLVKWGHRRGPLVDMAMVAKSAAGPAVV